MNYSGTKGRKLLNGDGPGGDAYNRFSGDLRDNGVRNRLNNSFAGVGLNESRIESTYHGVSLQLLRRYSSGFSFQAVYNYGRAKDYAGSAMIVEQPELDYGYASFDIPHQFKFNFIWEIPYHPSNAILNGVLGGWQLNGLAMFQSGGVFTVTCTQAFPVCDFNADGVNNDRVNLPSDGTDLGNPSQAEWIAGVMQAADFTFPAAGQVADQPRNAFRGPGFKNADISLTKNFRLPGLSSGRDSSFQVRLEMFNAFNWVNLNNPVSNANNANFGRVTGSRGNGAVGGPRVVQLGFKWKF